MADRELRAGSWRTDRCAFVLGSGPSMNADDAAAAVGSGCPVIVVNSTFRLAPAARVLYAMDQQWWAHHIAEVRATFSGALVSAYGKPGLGIASASHESGARGAGNSGAGATLLAMWLGAPKVVLLGFDNAPAADGRRHWHGAHPKPLSDAATMSKWPRHMERVAIRARAAGVAIVNASRETALEMFPRARLEEIL